MSDETAQGTFTGDAAQLLQALQSLEEHLTALQEKFANAGPGITEHLNGIEAAATAAAGALQGTAAAGGNAGGFFARASSGFQGFIHLLTEVSHWSMLIPSSLGMIGTALGNLLGKVTPLGPSMVSAFSNALPGIKHLLEQVSLVDRAVQAATGRLGPLGAAFGYMSARAVGASRSLAAFGAAAALATSAAVATARVVTGAVRGLASAAISAFGAVGAALHTALPEFLPLIAAVGLLSGAFIALQHAVKTSAEFETTTTSFTALVGNAEAAKKAIADLITFSDKTPFDKFQITEAGRQLVAFGFDAKNLLPILTDVGDLAAGMNRPLSDVASALGRLKGGQFGEAFMFLRGMGVTREALEAKGLKFDGSGQYHGSVESAMAGVRGVIQERFGGAMAALSTTWAGLWSTLVSKTGLILRGLGEPILAQLKPVLAEVIHGFADLAPLARSIGTMLASGLGYARTALAAVFSVLGQLGSALAPVLAPLRAEFGAVAVELKTLFSEIGALITGELASAFRSLGPILIGTLTLAVALLRSMLGGLNLVLRGVVNLVAGLNRLMGFKPVAFNGMPGAADPQMKDRPDNPPEKPLADARVGRMRELAGGGAFHLGLPVGISPELEENRRHTRLLEQLVKNTSGGTPQAHGQPVPVGI